MKVNFPRDPVFQVENGNWITQMLFLELTYEDTRYALYTLKERDHEFKGVVYPSIKRLYLELNDPTEYQFATTCLGGWEHWKRLQNSTTKLHPYIEEWREELAVRLRSNGVKGMIARASSGDLKAAQWLADKGFIEGEKRGRPSRASKQNEQRFKEQMRKDHEADIERITKLQ